ncbi:MAG: SAM-dependent methyltransferase [Myxococcota bacterium]|jgi:SAM-dependent methyltransferase
MEVAEEGGTLGTRAGLAEALASEQDHPAQAAGIRDRLALSGVSDGAVLLVTPCGDGALLAALRGWYTVSGCDPYDARLRLARRRLSGVPLWRSDRDDIVTEQAADVVVIRELEAIAEGDLAQVFTAAVAVLAPGGLLLILPSPTPDDLPVGTAMMDTHDGDGLKIVCSAVVRRSGRKARLERHWMVARDGGGVEAFTERHTLHLHTPDTIEAALNAASFSATHYPAPELYSGLLVAMGYTDDSTGA